MKKLFLLLILYITFNTFFLNAEEISLSITQIQANPSRIDLGGTLQLFVSYSCPENSKEKLKLEWSADKDGFFNDSTIFNPIFTLSENESYGECTFQITITDEIKTVTGTLIVNISRPPQINQAPIIHSSYQSTIETGPGEEIIFIIRANDPENTNLNFLWKKDRGNFNIQSDSTTDQYTQSMVIWQAPGCYRDPIKISADITNQLGLTVTYNFLLIQMKNAPPCSNTLPEIIQIESSINPATPGEKLNFSSIVNDADNDPLTFTWNTTCPGIFSNNKIKDPAFTIQKDAADGVYPFVLIVNDGKDEISSTYNLTVRKNSYPPYIISFKADPFELKKGYTTQLLLEIDDQDTPVENMTFFWLTDCPGIFDQQDITNPFFTVSDTALPGLYSIYVVIDDGTNETNIFTKIKVIDHNNPPIIISTDLSPNVIETNKSAQINVNAVDNDGDDLIYLWSTNCPGTFNDPNIHNPIFTASAIAEEQEYIMFIIVYDGQYSVSEGIPFNVKKTNNAPVINNISLSSQIISPGEDLLIQLDILDPENDPLTFKWTSTCPGNFDNDKAMSPIFTINQETPAGDYILTIEVADGINTLTGTAAFTVNKENTPPQIINLSLDPEQAEKSKVINLHLEYTDADGDTVDILWTTDCGGVFNNDQINSPTFTIDEKAQHGTYYIQVQLDDGKDTINQKIYFEVIFVNNPPTITSINTVPDKLEIGQTVQLSVSASDIDNHILSYEWTTDCPGFFNDITKPNPIFTPEDSAEFKSYNVEVTVNDGYDNAVKKTVITILPTEVFQLSEIASSDIDNYDELGTSVDIYGNTLIIGTPYEDGGQNDPIIGAGAAYIFDFENGQWNEAIKLTANDPDVKNRFGHAVAIHNNIAVVGAYNNDISGKENAGAAYIFEKDNTGNWVLIKRITASDFDECDNFGWSVDVYDNTIVIGAPNEDENCDNDLERGKVYIFEKGINGQWTETAKLTASNANDGDHFGYSLAIYAGTILVGAPHEDGGSGNPKENSGQIYFFEKNTNNEWEETAAFHASNADSSDQFGNSVDIYKNHAVIGAFDGDNGNDIDTGQAYIFKRDTENVWHETKMLRASNAAEYDYFGKSVSINDKYIIIGAYKEDGGPNSNYPNTGSSYIFKQNESGEWLEYKILFSPYKQEEEKFGSQVAITDNYAVISSPCYDSQKRNSGNVYILQIYNKPLND